MAELQEIYAAFDALPELLGRVINDPAELQKEFAELARSHPVVAHLWCYRGGHLPPTNSQDLAALVVFLGNEARILREINQKLVSLMVTNTVVIPAPATEWKVGGPVEN